MIALRHYTLTPFSAHYYYGEKRRPPGDRRHTLDSKTRACLYSQLRALRWN